MTEGQQLDAMTLDNAKVILCQIGWFAEDTCFMSLRLTPSQFATIQYAINDTLFETPEELLSELCRLYADPHGRVEVT